MPLPSASKRRRVVHLDVRRENENPDAGILLPDGAGRLEPFDGLRGRHPDVHEHQVGGELAHEGQQLTASPASADHLESGATEQPRHSRRRSTSSSATTTATRARGDSASIVPGPRDPWGMTPSMDQTAPVEHYLLAGRRRWWLTTMARGHREDSG